MPLEHYARFTARACFSLLVVLVLVFPMVWGVAKGVLLAYCAVAVLLVEALQRTSFVCVHRRTFIFFGSLLCINGFFVIWGMWNGAPAAGSLEVANVYLVFPLVYMFLAGVTSTLISPKSMINVLLFVSFFVAFLTIAQSARVFGLGIMPGYSILYYIYPGLDQDYLNIGFTGFDGFLPRASERLAFLAPFGVALLAVGDKFGLPRKLVWANFLLLLVAVALTGRRVFLLIVVVSVLGLVVTRVAAARRQVLNAIAAAGIVGILGLAVYQVLERDVPDAASRVDAVSSNVAGDLGNLDFSIRQDQVGYILAEADRNPVLGAGFGNIIPGHVRDPEHPWRFELTYVALLFQTGAVGICLYAFLALQLFALAKDAWTASRESLLPFIVGMVGGLVAAGTNPYLNYGSGQWILFLPILIFNAVLVQSRLRQASITAADGLERAYGGARNS